MLDGVHTGSQRGCDSVASDGVRGDFLADAMRLVHDRLCFFIREIHHGMQHAVALKMVPAVGVIFDPVGAIHRLFAHGFARAVDSIHILHAGRNLQLPGITKQRIHSRGSHSPSGHLHARAGHFAVGDCGLHVHVRVHGAFRLQVANGRKPV